VIGSEWEVPFGLVAPPFFPPHHPFPGQPEKNWRPQRGAPPLPRGKQKVEQANSSTLPHPRLLCRLPPAFAALRTVDPNDQCSVRGFRAVFGRPLSGSPHVRSVVDQPPPGFSYLLMRTHHQCHHVLYPSTTFHVGRPRRPTRHTMHDFSRWSHCLSQVRVPGRPSRRLGVLFV